MSKSFKKALSLLLSLMMLTGMCSVGAVTAGAADKDYTITLGQTVTVEVDAGGSACVTFTPAVSGRYVFFSTSDSDTKAYLYTSSGNQIAYDDDSGSNNNFKIEWSLVAGNTYKYKVFYYHSDTSGSFDVTLTHNHVDSDEDGKCDICAVQLTGTIAPGETKELSIPAHETRGLIFTCENTGFYMFDYSSVTNGYDYVMVLDPSGEDLNCWFGEEFYAVKGQKYTLQVIADNSDTVFSGITVTGNYTDNDGDGKCDYTGTEFSSAVAYGETVNVTIPENEVRELVFNCQQTAFYSFKYSDNTNGYNYAHVFGPFGEMWSGFNEEFYAVAGSSYKFRIFSYSDTEITGITLNHGHSDTDGDGKCDFCSVEFSSSIALDESKDVEVPGGEMRELAFTPEKSGIYRATYDSNEGYVSLRAYDSAGRVLDLFEGAQIAAGETARIRFRSYSGSGAYRGFRIYHTHSDKDGDGKCDVCSVKYTSKIALGEFKDVVIPADDFIELLFTSEKEGVYEINYNSSSGSWGCDIFDSEGNDIGGTYDSLYLSAGDVIYIRFYNYSTSDTASISDVTVWHDHFDIDADGKCDVCSAEYTAKIALGESKDVEIPGGDYRELVFTCEKDGEYLVDYDSYSGSLNAEIADSSGNYFADFGDTMTLSAGDVIYIRAYAYPGSNAKIKGVTVLHYHTDGDSDDICDICGEKIVYNLELDKTETIVIPHRDTGKIATFTPEKTGDYKLVISDRLYSYCYAGCYDAHDNACPISPYAVHPYATLTAGETYTFYFDGYTKDVTGEMTITHGHYFDTATDICSICEKQIIFTAQEDEPVAVSIDAEDMALVRFTPAKSGEYCIEADSANITSCYDSSLSVVSPSGGDIYNGDYYTLSAGETYYFALSNFEATGITAEATVTHRHTGTPTALLEPTAACSGIDEIECETCSEHFYSLTDWTGSTDYNSTTDDGFSYAVLKDDDGNKEAAITGYLGTETDVVYPSEIEGIPVTAIIEGNGISGLPAFNSTITSVTIPDSVREIGAFAFSGYTALEEVTIPDSVLIIGEGAFRGCVNLEGVTIGENVIYIGEDAFTTVIDEQSSEYLEYLRSQAENEYDEFINNPMTQDVTNATEEVFKQFSDFSGKEITTWDEVIACIDAATLDELEAYFDFGYTDKEDYYDNFSFLMFIYKMIESYESRFDGINEALDDLEEDDGTPLAWVIYNGSEEDFGKIILEKNNEELTEARTGFDGEDPAFTITYDANGGENAPEAQTGFKDVTLSADEPEYYSYTFLGWATETDAQEADYAAGAEYYLIADTTLYAVWEETVDTLTYDANGGANAPAAQTGFGEITLSSAKPAREGYEFLGWAATKDAAEAEYEAGGSYLLEEDATLYAVWQKINTLTYDANGGKDAPAAQKGNGEITLSSAKPSREGYEFLGWAATKDAAEAEYEAGGSYLLEEDATLYAVWQKLNTLTYDANGGKDAPAAQKGNGEITLSSAKPSRSGYEFLGWAKTKDAEKADYAAGAKYDLKADTTLYAVWKALFALPEFSAKSAPYNTYVTVKVNLNNVPAGAEVYIDGKKAEASGSTYSADIGQVKATKDLKIEVKQGGEVLDSSTLTVKVDSGFFAKLISFFTNFLFNLFSWKKVPVTF